MGKVIFLTFMAFAASLMVTLSFMTNDRGEESKQSVTSPVSEPKPAPSQTPLEGSFLPGMDCLVNNYGIRRKVLIKDRGVRCVSYPNQPASTGPYLKFFQPYYVFAVFPRPAEELTDEVYSQAEIQYYQIGTTPRKDSVIGWVSAEQVAQWDTRVGVRYARGKGDRVPPLLIYRDKKDLVGLVEKGTASSEPIARAKFVANRTYMPWPVSEVDHYTSKGRSYEFLRINFLGGVPAGSTFTGGSIEPVTTVSRYKPEEIQEMKEQVRALDVVFVIDLTSSMGIYLESVKKTVAQIANNLVNESFKPRIRFGLVAYRDRDPKSLKLLERVDMKEKYQDFLDEVGKLGAHGGGDEPEAVFEGLKEALVNTNWADAGLTDRILILIGDCPGHEPGTPGNPENVSAQEIISLSRDRSRNVRIFALAVGRKGGNVFYDKRWEQFSLLANSTGGMCVELDSADLLMERVTGIVRTRTAVIHNRSSVLDGLADGKDLKQVVAEKQIKDEDLVEVMEFLEGAGVDLDRLKVTGPSFATGWCMSTDLSGYEIVSKEVFVARAELDVLLSDLNNLCAFLSPNIADQVFRNSIGSRIGPLSFFAEERSGPMDVFLMAKGIPCTQGVLKLTRAEIEHMPEIERARLREKIATRHVPALTNARNDSRYFSFVDDLEFGWIDEKIFP